MATAKLTRTVKLPTFTLTETRTRSGVSALSVTKSLPKAIYGVLASRPTATTGNIVLATESHGIVVSDKVDLYYQSGLTLSSFLNATVTAVNGEVLTVDTSASTPTTNLPATLGSTISVAPQVSFTLDVPDVTKIIAFAAGIRFARQNSLTIPQNCAFRMLATPANFYVTVSGRGGRVWDVSSIVQSESALDDLHVGSGAYTGGTVSCPTYLSNATFNLQALLSA